MKTHIEYDWARKREQINELLPALITGLKKDESLSWPWLKSKVREGLDLKQGFEQNCVHSMVYCWAKKFVATGNYEIVIENNIKYIKRIK